MKNIHEGQRVTYYPPPSAINETPHFPAVIERIKKRVLIKVFSSEAPSGQNKWVKPEFLADNQMELL